jgi:hypothetical protein
MHSLRAADRYWRSGGNRSGRVFYAYNLPHVIDLNAFAGLAMRVMAVGDAGSAR